MWFCSGDMSLRQVALCDRTFMLNSYITWNRNSSHLTFLLVLQNMTACVMVNVSYKSQSVSNFHSSLSTATKNCLIPSSVNSSLQAEIKLYHSRVETDYGINGGTYRFTSILIGSVMNFDVISRISWGSVALRSTTCEMNIVMLGEPQVRSSLSVTSNFN